MFDRKFFSDRSQFSFHAEDFCDSHSQCCCDFVCQQNGRIRASAFNAHDGLAADTCAQCQFLLRHIFFEAQTADCVLQFNGRHNDEWESGAESRSGGSVRMVQRGTCVFQSLSPLCQCVDCTDVARDGKAPHAAAQDLQLASAAKNCGNLSSYVLTFRDAIYCMGPQLVTPDHLEFLQN